MRKQLIQVLVLVMVAVMAGVIIYNGSHSAVAQQDVPPIYNERFEIEAYVDSVRYVKEAFLRNDEDGNLTVEFMAEIDESTRERWAVELLYAGGTSPLIRSVYVDREWIYTLENFTTPDGIVATLATPQGAAHLDADDIEATAEAFHTLYSSVAAENDVVSAVLQWIIPPWLIPIAVCANDCHAQHPQPNDCQAQNPTPLQVRNCCIWNAQINLCFQTCMCQQEHGNNHYDLAQCITPNLAVFHNAANACLQEYLQHLT